MNEPLEFLVRHGVRFCFAAVFVEHWAFPLPAAPWLLAGGALAASGKINCSWRSPPQTFGSVLAIRFGSIWGKYGVSVC